MHVLSDWLASEEHSRPWILPKQFVNGARRRYRTMQTNVVVHMSGKTTGVSRV